MAHARVACQVAPALVMSSLAYRAWCDLASIPCTPIYTASEATGYRFSASKKLSKPHCPSSWLCDS